MHRSPCRSAGHPAFTTLLLAGLLMLAPMTMVHAGFDADFSDKTMRLDYFHTGGPGGEVISLDRVVSDGRWAGSRTRLLDTTNTRKSMNQLVSLLQILDCSIELVVTDKEAVA